MYRVGNRCVLIDSIVHVYRVEHLNVLIDPEDLVYRVNNLRLLTGLVIMYIYRIEKGNELTVLTLWYSTCVQGREPACTD